MADDKKNPDEYEYPSEDYYKGGEYRPPDENLEPLETEEPSAAKSTILSKRLYLIIGVLLAIGLMYLIIAYHSARRTADLATPTPVDTSAAANIPPTTTNTFQAEQPSVSAPVDTSGLQNITTQNQATQQSIADLQGQVQQLQSQISTITNALSTLNNQIQIMANEVRAIALDRQLRGRSVNLISTGIAYQLKAIVPGRAWLQAKNGTTTTVTIGDRLPGYGIVQTINVAQGIVTTSSGVIIQYGTKDS